MIGPHHLSVFDGALDRRPRWYRLGWKADRERRAALPGRVVDTWHAHIAGPPHCVWPPIAVDDQREYGRRLLRARRMRGALITVIHRRGATALLIIDVFGPELTDLEQHRIRRLLGSLTPAKAYGKIRPWVAIEVGPFGGFTTNAVDHRWDPDDWNWGRWDVLSPAVEALAAILAGDTAERRAA